MLTMLCTDSQVSPTLSGPLRSIRLLLQCCLAAAVLLGSPQVSRTRRAPAPCTPSPGRVWAAWLHHLPAQSRIPWEAHQARKTHPIHELCPPAGSKTLPPPSPQPAPRKAWCSSRASLENKNKEWLTTAAVRPAFEGPGSKCTAGAKVICCTFQWGSLQSCLPLWGF